MTLLNNNITLIRQLISELSAEHQQQIETLLLEGNIHSSPLWAAHMTPNINAKAQLGKLIATVHNGNLLSAELYPQLADIEQQLLAWFCQLFQQSHAHFTHGSSYANLEALWQARDHSKNTSNLVYASQDVHYSVIKACQILGLDFRAIATNQEGKMDEEALRSACEKQVPIAIVATAGTSSRGAIDPIIHCLDLAEEFSCWCHIDAAWGGALVLLPDQSALPDLSRANSICVDPHKAFSQPRPCGVLLYQQALNNLAIETNYLHQSPKRTLAGSYGGELFLPLWFSLLFVGEKALRQQIKNKLKQAEKFYTLIKENTDWWCSDSVTGIICFRPTQNLPAYTALLEQGLISETIVNERKVYRTVFANEQANAEQLFAELTQP